jgi:hypothetical protein
MKRAITVLFLGITSLVLGASAIGCVGAPDGGEEAEAAPTAVEDRAAYTAEQAAAHETIAEAGPRVVEDSTAYATAEEAAEAEARHHPGRKMPNCDGDACCTLLTNGDLFCCFWTSEGGYLGCL